MSDLQAIADRFQIKALRGEYSEASMMRDWDRLRRCSHTRARGGSPMGNVELVGREEIRAGIERLRGLWDYFETIDLRDMDTAHRRRRTVPARPGAGLPGW